MPAPTPQEIQDQMATDALAGIAKTSGELGSVELMSAEDRAAMSAAAVAATGKSGWGGCLKARVVPPGAQ